MTGKGIPAEEFELPSEDERKERLRRYIKLYRNEGIRLVPLKPKSKQPLVKWSELRDKPLDDQEVEGWFRSFADFGLAAICGRPSGGLVVIDFDDSKAFDRFMNGLVEKDLIVRTWTVETARGFHVYFRLPDELIDGIRNKQLSTGVELKADGGLATLPPSIHESGH